MRRLGHALQFLTQLPTPRTAEFSPADLSRSAVWFPVVGLIIGVALAAAFYAGRHISPWTAGLLTLVVWVWITGALHLDGLADVADALAAAHRSPDRFLEVLRDPHIGAFGAIAIALQLVAKLVLVAELPSAQAAAALFLIPAWARWGTLLWSYSIPPLAGGSGERFSWEISPAAIAAHGLALALLSIWAAPILLGALLIVPAIALYWKRRLGGITGDCLGASVEATETLLLALFVAQQAWGQ